MNDRAALKLLALSIAAVERDTGLSKDTLRIWERRYGFPAPARDAIGERAYPLEQVEKLRIIKRLLDSGHRPGRIVGMTVEDLQRLADSSGTTATHADGVAMPPDLRIYLDRIRHHDVVGLRREFGQARARQGLERFVLEVIAPLNALVGEAWMRGQMEIFEEHMYTESAQVALRSAIEGLPPAAIAEPPAILLTTLPGEPHGLGLLMAEALLAIEGARCVSLGVQTPIWDIVLGAAAYRADVVALSFTGCMNPNHVVDGLTELRTKLPPSVEVWAGGSAPVLRRRPVDGVRPIADLPELAGEVRRLRDRRPWASAVAGRGTRPTGAACCHRAGIAPN